MTDHQTPESTPPPLEGAGRRNLGASLATWSGWLAFAAPFVGILSMLAAIAGAHCPTPPDYSPDPNLFAVGISNLSPLVYYGAILVCASAVSCGVLAIVIARRSAADRNVGCELAGGIVFGLFVGVLLIDPGYLFFSFLYVYGSQGICLS
jgi:hypothetical protein